MRYQIRNTHETLGNTAQSRQAGFVRCCLKTVSLAECASEATSSVKVTSESGTAAAATVQEIKRILN